MPPTSRAPERLDLPLDQAGVAVADAEHLPALVEARAHDGADGRVHSGRVAAAGQDRDLPDGHGAATYSTGGCYPARPWPSSERHPPRGRHRTKAASADRDELHHARPGFRRLTEELTSCAPRSAPRWWARCPTPPPRATARRTPSTSTGSASSARSIAACGSCPSGSTSSRSSTPPSRSGATGSSSAPPSPSRTRTATEATYRIVGVDETDGAAGDISWRVAGGAGAARARPWETPSRSRWHAGASRELTIAEIESTPTPK